MNDAFRIGALLLALSGCNELLGLDAGKLGGNAGEAGEGASAEGGTSGAMGGTSPSSGGTDATSGDGGRAGDGAGATSGDAGRAGDGTGGSAAGRGGNAGRGGSDADNGGTGGFADGACGRNRDCIEQGFDWPGICQSGRCIDITTDDCNIVMGAEHLSTEIEPVIFGVLFTGLDPVNIGRSAFYWDLQLAMDEFVEEGGIPIGGVVRRPLLIACHGPANTDPEWIARSLDHLVDNVGVPGIVALTTPNELAFAAQRTLFGAKPHDVFFLHHSGTNANLANLDDGGRVWHMLGSDLDVAPTYVPLVERVEAKVNPLGTANRRPTRLVLLQPGGTFFFGARLWMPLDATLRINGALAHDQDQENYFVVSPEGRTWNDTFDAIAELNPDIVVDLSGNWDISYYLDQEMRSRSLPPPYYVVTGAVANDLDLIYLMYLDPTLRERVVGVNTAAAEDTTLYDAFMARARLLPTTVSLMGTENIYDPLYFLFYAAAAAGVDGTLDGTKLASAMKRLTHGERHDIGPAEIPTIFELLTDASEPDASIAFYATMGAPDFDERTGARIVGGSVYCVRDDLSFASDVLRYDRMTQSLYGTFPCFDF